MIFTTPSSSENSEENDGGNSKLPTLSSIIGTGNDNINIVISDDDRNVSSINSENDIENALSSRERIPTPTLLLDPSGNNTDVNYCISLNCIEMINIINSTAISINVGPSERSLISASSSKSTLLFSIFNKSGKHNGIHRVLLVCV